MQLIMPIALLLFLLLAFVVFFGAPFVPTRKRELERVIKLAGLKPGQLLVDLGSGDGRLLNLAAKNGVRAIGYELSPLLAVISWLKTRKYRHLVKTNTKNYWRVQLPDDTDAVFVFLAKPFMARLEQYLRAHVERTKKPLVLISYGFELPGHTPEKQVGALLRYVIKP